MLSRGKCLLAQTFKRTLKLVGKDRVFVITNSVQVSSTRKICPQIPARQILVEPVGRNTTAVIGVSALFIEKISRGNGASFAVLPSDHVVKPLSAFLKTARKAFSIAEETSGLVTIGINPQFPATGYGYIKRGESFEANAGTYFKISRFFEKPSLDRAMKYIESADFYWNAGMFVWEADAILKAIKENASEIFQGLSRIGASLTSRTPFRRALGKHYGKIEKINIDFSVIGKARNAYVVPAEFEWDDVGSWTAVGRNKKKDSGSNYTLSGRRRYWWGE